MNSSRRSYWVVFKSAWTYSMFPVYFIWSPNIRGSRQIGVTKHRTSRIVCAGPNIGLSVIYSYKYITFSNSRQVRQCQNVLTAGHTVHLSLFHNEYLFWKPVWMARSAGNPHNCSGIIVQVTSSFALPSSIPVFILQHVDCIIFIKLNTVPIFGAGVEATGNMRTCGHTDPWIGLRVFYGPHVRTRYAKYPTLFLPVTALLLLWRTLWNEILCKMLWTMTVAVDDDDDNANDDCHVWWWRHRSRYNIDDVVVDLVVKHVVKRRVWPFNVLTRI